MSFVRRVKGKVLEVLGVEDMVTCPTCFNEFPRVCTACPYCAEAEAGKKDGAKPTVH